MIKNNKRNERKLIIASKQKILGHLIFYHKENCTKCGQIEHYAMTNAKLNQIATPHPSIKSSMTRYSIKQPPKTQQRGIQQKL
jgi:hypothetical protein